MVRKKVLQDLLDLPTDDRMLLLEALWESLADSAESAELTPAQRAELESRLSALEADPEAGSPWSEVRDRITRRT